jgi:putative oxygen-independent coproporphyrinogen III oxidase
MRNKDAPAPAGLYVHVPFCKTKCPYCDFYSTTDLSLIPAWLQALEREIESYRDTFASFDSLFLGGGTPSCLGPRHMERLLETVRGNFSLAPDTEVTCEANPDDVSAGVPAFWRSLGINRLSIGVQSFHDDELSFLQRRHTADTARRAIELAQRTGFENIGLDLMYGFPGHSVTRWQDTLKTALSFSPTHLSCYQTTISADTPFGLLLREGKLVKIESEEERRFFLFTARFLTKTRFIHYEISNFARYRRLRCRHNMKYWDHTPYLGLGPSAHSFLGGKRWWNLSSVVEYCAALQKGGLPTAGSEDLSPEQLDLENLFLGLRTMDGVILESGAGASIDLQSLSRLRQQGLVRVRNGRVLPTRKGFLFADSLPLLLN